MGDVWFWVILFAVIFVVFRWKQGKNREKDRERGE